MQFYESSFPSENALVAIRITHIHEYGVEAVLLEYADAPRGIIYNKDLTRKRVRSIKEVVRIGQETIATVVAVSAEAIDLSIRNCNKEDIETGLHTFGRHRTIHNILRSIAITDATQDLTRRLYETVVWPLHRLELDVYDTFLQLHNPDFQLPVETPYAEEIRRLVLLRLPPPRVSKFRDIALRSSNSLHAPDAITETLHAVADRFACEVFVISPPLYRFQVQGVDEADAVRQLDTIESFASSFVPQSGATDTSAVMSAEEEIPLDLAEIAKRQATMNLGTLGNVSEGKSTFVRALAKVATQRHQKEKRTNITIHLGYAGFKIWRHVETGDLTSTASTCDTLAEHELLGHYSFVDCPGHEAYLATMLSGAAIMDAAALLVAANSPKIPQVQTQEHLIAAETIGLQNVFVIQNKLDVVDTPVVSESLEKIRAFVKGTAAERSPLLPMSAQREWGIEYALHHIAYNLPTPVRTFEGPVRMQIVRSFDINRPARWTTDAKVLGGVVGGSIQRGVLHPDDLLEIRPGLFVDGEAIPLLTRVSSLHCDSEQLPFAIAGGLIGVGTALDPAYTAANALIGQIAGTPGTLPAITRKIKGKFKAFDRGAAADEGDELAHKFKKHKEGEKIHFCVGSMTVSGEIVKVGEKGKRTIKLDRPVCVEVGQICSVLRSNGTRNLLDGILTVEAVKPFERVRPLYHAELAATFQANMAERKYRVIPNARISDPTPLPTYECMLDAVETHMTDTKGETIKLPPPAVQRLPKKTAWLNTGDTLAALEAHAPDVEGKVRVDTHFQDYLMSELATTLTVKKDGQYILAGRFTEANFRTILRKYIQKYHKCAQCGSCKTCLLRHERSLRIFCGECTSYTPIHE